MLVGGFAGVVHGATQVTRDLDVCMALTNASVGELRAALSSLNPRHRMNPSHQPSFLEEPKDISGWRNLYLQTDIGVLDILSEITGVGDFERVKARSVPLTLNGADFRVISIEDLITAKERLGRDKDKIVAKDLRVILKNRS